NGPSHILRCFFLSSFRETSVRFFIHVSNASVESIMLRMRHLAQRSQFSHNLSSLLSPVRSFGMEQMLTIARTHASHPRSSSTQSLWIGILNQLFSLFSERRYIASAPSLSIALS